jgi:acetolactate synthase-1/2/3 large subunit
MASVTGGELVARCLVREGVGHMFCLHGGHIDPILRAAHELGIRLVDTRHEEAAAHAASAYSFVKGKPGVVCVTAGPGVTNHVTGMANAFLAGSPVLSVCASSPLGEADRGVEQDIDQLAIMKPITKWARTAHSLERIPEYMAMAFRELHGGKPGPVFLEIPMDILFEEIEESEVSFPERYRPEGKVFGDPALIEKAADLLSRAERPLVVVGTGGCLSRAGDALLRVVEKMHVPVLSCNAGRGVLPDAHPLSFGSYLPISLSPAAIALNMADCVLVLGTRFNKFFAYGYLIGEDAAVIQVDIDPTEIGRNRPVDVGIVGDIREVLCQMNGRVKGREEPAEWIQMLETFQVSRFEEMKPMLTSSNVPIHPLRLVYDIQQFLDEESIVICDGGEISVTAGCVMGANGYGSLLSHSPLGDLGIGIPYGIGAKAACPEKPVLVVSGDGSFGFNAMEFDTAVRNRIPFVAVIANDQAWGMCKHFQELKYGRGQHVATLLGNTRYDKVVEALGGYGELVTEPDEIIPALERAFQSGLPACLNVMTDPDYISEATAFE